MRMHSSSRGALLAIALALGALASERTATAQVPTDSPNDPAMQQAKVFFDEANDLYGRQLYTEAAMKFREAYDSKPLAAFLFNAGVAYEKAKNLQQAIELFRRYLSENPTAQDRAKLEKRIAGLEQILNPTPEPSPDPKNPDGQPPPVVKPPVLEAVNLRGIVNVETKPPGAKIYLDNKRTGSLGSAPWSASLEGEHTLIIEAKGFKPETKKISPASDKILEIYIALSKEDYLGYVEITSNVPKAEVYFDNKAKGSIGRTPYTGFLKPGKHKLWVEREGYEPIEKELDIKAGKAHEQSIALEPIAYGWVEVRAPGLAGAALYVDGKKTCIVPCKAPVDAGKRRISVRKGGKKAYSQKIEIGRATSTNFKVALAAKPSRFDAYLALFASAGFIGGGIYFGMKSADAYDSLEADIKALGGAPIDSGDSRFDDGKLNAYIADGMFALAGVTGLLGTYYLFRDKGASSQGVYQSKSLVGNDSQWKPIIKADVIDGKSWMLGGEVTF